MIQAFQATVGCEIATLETELHLADTAGRAPARNHGNSPMDASFIQHSSVPVTLDDRQVEKRIGLIILATDHTTERDFARMCPHDRTGIYCSRILNENPTTPENLRRMQPRLSESAGLILPDEPLDVMSLHPCACVAQCGLAHRFH